MKTERIVYPGNHGADLAARLTLPADGAVKAYALFAHCFTCSKDLKPVVNISRVLTEAGISALRFDFTGLGESEGDFSGTTFSSNIEDLIAAAEYLKSRHGAPAILIGHSLGGAAVLQAAARIPSVRAVATIGAPFDPAHVKQLFADSLEDIENRGHGDIVVGGRRFTVSRAFVRDLDRQHMEQTIAALRRPLLIFHSPVDQTVGIENAALIYKAARHPKSFVAIDTGHHLLLAERDSVFVGSVLAAWAVRYVNQAEQHAAH
jgi:putative redox protein